ncbi:hypothetical protein T03_7068 [Trichinella britovi]|uniref:Uncharacterized protein n=1 Tax=Trichinella britovi TaxID=45882 RepID=A0A0V1BIC3_TRIBR|nr:hypothetical protein T03_7068 [Trichinella britovi]
MRGLHIICSTKCEIRFILANEVRRMNYGAFNAMTDEENH